MLLYLATHNARGILIKSCIKIFIDLINTSLYLIKKATLKKGGFRSNNEKLRLNYNPCYYRSSYTCSRYRYV